MAARYFILQSSCALCADDTADTIYVDATARVAFHEDWAVRGHVMVIAREHVENLSELSDPSAFLSVYVRAERALLEATGCERAIVMKLGLLTPHLHLHIYPVPASATRAEVMAAIDGKTRVPRDQELIDQVRYALSRGIHRPTSRV
jgi:diadenosine tetraphosphate (Ap4A) HIT family hydrolase